MKNIALAALAAIALSTSGASAEVKLATIDIEKIVDLHPETKHNREILRDTVKDYQADLEALEGAVVAARKAAETAIDESRNPALGEKARAKAEEEAKKKIEIATSARRDFEEKRMEHQRSLNEQEVRMLRLTVRQIESEIAKYAKANGITAVLPTTGSRLGIAPAAVWADESIDITKAIMDILGLKDEPAEENAEGEPAPDAKAAE